MAKTVWKREKAGNIKTFEAYLAQFPFGHAPRVEQAGLFVMAVEGVLKFLQGLSPPKRQKDRKAERQKTSKREKRNDKKSIRMIQIVMHGIERILYKSEKK